MRGIGLRARLTATIATAVVAMIAALGAASASAATPVTGHRHGGHGTRPRWVLTRHWTLPSVVAGEGVARYPNGRLLFRGVGEVPPAVAALGFDHVGDEDIDAAGYVYDDYENDHPDPTSKLFTVTAPDGRVSLYPHPLAAGEEFNNSFATVSPDDRWLVSGEWNLEPRLLLFANPRGLPSGTSIGLAGQIALHPALNHVQGCDFLRPRRLICDVDATAAVHPVVEVDLARTLHRGVNPATDHRLFIPREVSACPGSGFENEGIDFNPLKRLLTLTMNQPGDCDTTSSVDVYRLTG